LSKQIRVGIVHSDADYRYGFRLLVDSQPDLEFVFEDSTANSALSRIADALIDVLVVDYFISGLTGVEFTAKLSQLALDQDAKLTPVILTNVSFSDRLRLEMLRAGVSDILPLDAYPETLLKSLRDNAFGGPKTPRSELLAFFERLALPARPNPALALGLANLSDADAAAIALFADGLEDPEIAAQTGEQAFRVRRRIQKLARQFGFADRRQLFLALYENGKLNG
jgi:DNA-binding NarL/FixJ family response regulator